MNSDKPKILFLMHMPPPMHGAAQVGQHIHDSKLINESFECRYLNPSASENVKDVGKLSLNKIKFLFSFLNKINKSADEFHPDLVYLTPSSDGWGFYRDYINVLFLRHKGYRVISHFHNKPAGRFVKKWYNRLIYRSFFKELYTIFLSKRLIHVFDEYIDKDKLNICPNGVKTNTEFPVQHRIDESKPFRFLFLSNMMEEKGVYVLLEACRYLKERGCNFTCTFIGKWSDVTEEDFREKLEVNNLEDCVFAVGAKYDNDKVEYFVNSDCFVFPTFFHSECFPLVLLEAMSYGLPCISTTEGGILDIIDDGKTGVIIPSIDARILAEKMLFLAEHRDIALQMGVLGKMKYNQEYSLEIFEKNIISILKKSLK